MGIFRKRHPRGQLPPGQHEPNNFPVLHVGEIPYKKAPPDWSFRVYGEVDTPLTWSLNELRAQPSREVTVDIHCVTSWSKTDTLWRGVPVSDVLTQVTPTPSATHVLAHADGGYTTNLPLSALDNDEVLLAYEYDGEDLDPEHGYPLRLLVPSLYFWKSAKWLRGLEVLSKDRLGYWERYGYSNSADPWKEERYAF